jgi:Undecaprenyl-phosphate galactose phosphotransferase WbaP
VERLVWGCNKIVVIPQSMGLLWSWMRTRDCGGVVGLEVRRELLRRRARLTKRAMDYTLALGGGALILPWIAIVAILVKLSSHGPAFYGQPRIGEGGRNFRAWKFRTMVENADEILEGCLRANPELEAEWDAQHKLRSDPRVTRIGKFLRQTSLDELPQIWNVLRGEMSLVGPRPIVRHEVEKYAEEFDLYLKVRPGITGLWQVSGRSETTYEERVGMDGHYVRNWSVWLDIYLLARTVGVVLRKQGAY